MHWNMLRCKVLRETRKVPRLMLRWLKSSFSSFNSFSFAMKRNIRLIMALFEKLAFREVWGSQLGKCSEVYGAKMLRYHYRKTKEAAFFWEIFFCSISIRHLLLVYTFCRNFLELWRPRHSGVINVKWPEYRGIWQYVQTLSIWHKKYPEYNCWERAEDQFQISY